MNHALIPSSGEPGVPGSHRHVETPKPAENPLLLIHKLLRGRYVLAALLAIVLGPLGGAAGYWAVNLEYTSNSIIRIAPQLPKILTDTDQTSMLPMFDSYLQTQVSLLSSPRVIEMAMQSDLWQEMGGGYSIEALPEFMESLSVTQPRNSQLIYVGFSDTDRVRAQAATKSVVSAYMSVYVDQDVKKDRHRNDILHDLEKELSQKIDTLTERMKEVAREFGSDDLSSVYAFEMTNSLTLKAELEAAKLQLASLEAITGDEKPQPPQDYALLTVEDIALTDSRMQSLVDERTRLQRQVDSFKSTLRRPESRPAYRLTLEALEAQEKEIEEYATAFRENPLLAASPLDGPGRLAPSLSLAQQQAKVDRLEVLLKEAQAQTVKTGNENLKLKQLRTSLARLNERWDLTKTRIETLSVEASSSLSGRIEVLSEAEMPTTPSNAKRRIQFTVLGGLAGGGLGIALVLGLGFLNARIRDIEDAQDIKPRLLGALPLLPDTITNLDKALEAAQCVHHIRTILHAHMPPESLTLTVSASNSGAGKTSFALSLGLSFASAGARTLIIDGDVVGTGLTRRTGATGRRKLGHVLRAYEVITEEEAKHALEVARHSGYQMGRSLLELGYISERDLEDGLSMQKDAGLGLADALDGEYPENCLASIGVPNLTILPASRRKRTQSHATSPVAFRRLLEELRPSFDIILIDAGPVPGTTDATVMATCADGVVMVASRGDDGGDVQRTLKHLNDLNVPIVGLVFNRADTRDIERSKFSSSTMSSDKHGEALDDQATEHNPAELTARLASVAAIGPLPQSVWLSTMAPANQSTAEAPV